MTKQIYLGVDLGAESGRVMAGHWDGKSMRLEEVHRFSNGGIPLQGSLRWDVLNLWKEIQTGLTKASQLEGEIQSVGVDTWGVDYVLLSRERELLGMPYTYRDSRTQGIMDQVLHQISREKIFEATGLQFMGINTLYQLVAHLEQQPGMLEQAHRFLMMPDFFHWCLCGAEVGEFSNATTTQCYDPRRQSWARSLLAELSIPPSIFPEVVPPGTPIGKLTQSVERETGLRGVQVIAPATHDTGSAVAAIPAPAGREDWAYISSGTWSLMGMECPKPKMEPAVLRANLTNEGGVDYTSRVLRNIMGLWLVQGIRKSLQSKGEEMGYPQLVQAAAQSPAHRSWIRPNDPRFLNPSDMAEEIRSACRETSQPVPSSAGELVRCALESLALMYQEVLQDLNTVRGSDISQIHVVGGGSQNHLLNQWTADACGIPVLAGPVEATVLGNVLVQARGAGELGSLQEIRQVVTGTEAPLTYTTNSQTSDAWLQARETFSRLPIQGEVS